MLQKSLLFVFILIYFFLNGSLKAINKSELSSSDTVQIINSIEQFHRFYVNFEMDSCLYYARKAITLSKQVYDLHETQSNEKLFNRVKSLTIQSYVLYSRVISDTKTANPEDTLKAALSLLDDSNTLEKGLLFSALSYHFRSVRQIETAFSYSKRALELFKLSGSDTDYVNELILVGVSLRENGKFGESLDYFMEALKKSRQLKDDTLITESLLAIGFLYGIVEKWEDAIKYQMEALTLFQKTNTLTQIARAHNDLGVTHFYAEKLDSALYHHKKALGIRLVLSNPYDTFSSYFYVGEILERQNKIKESIEFKEKGLLYQDHPYKADVVKIYKSIGDDYVLLSDLKKAAKNYKIALQISKENYNVEGEIESLVKLAQLVERRNEYSKALNLLKVAEMKAPKVRIQVKYDFYYSLSIIYTKLGDYKNAYLNSVIHSDLKDSLLAAKNISKITKMTNLMAFENELALRRENNEKIIALKQAEINREKSTRNIFLGGMIFAVVLVIITLFRFFEKKKLTDTLTDTLSNLKGAQNQLIQAEKMATLGELTAGVAHEIQNPLNFVNNFSELSSELVDEMIEELESGEIEEAKAIGLDIKRNLAKITDHGKRADSIVKGMLAHSRTGKSEKQLTDINKLADEYLKLSYHGLRAKNKSFNADFKADFDADLPKVNAIPQDIGRVLLNLINNAFQACAEVEKPKVCVSTKQTERGIEISVSDNGPGIPDEIKEKIFQPFFTTKPTGEGTGLGLSLSFDIVKAHGGQIEIESEPGKTVFQITLPLV